MCLQFLPLIAAAASVAGTGLSMAGAQEARDAANRATSQELERQRKLQVQAEQQYAMARNQATPEQAASTISGAANQRQQDYQQIQGLPLSYSQPGTQIGKAVVNARDAANLNLSNRARAALSGYDQWLLNRQIEQQQTGNLLGVTAGLARSSGNVLPIELGAAQHAGDTLSGVGSLLGTAGSAMGSYAASNGSLCGPQAAPSTAPGTTGYARMIAGY